MCAFALRRHTHLAPLRGPGLAPAPCIPAPLFVEIDACQQAQRGKREQSVRQGKGEDIDHAMGDTSRGLTAR